MLILMAAILLAVTYFVHFVASYFAQFWPIGTPVVGLTTLFLIAAYMDGLLTLSRWPAKRPDDTTCRKP